MKAVSRARASFADGFPMTVFLSCLREAVVICRTVITLHTAICLLSRRANTRSESDFEFHVDMLMSYA